MRRILTPEAQATEHAKTLRISRHWRARTRNTETRIAFDRVLRKMYWRRAPASMRLYTALRRARSRLRSACWRALRRVPAIDQWAIGRFACRR
jgi:hypothetical protein